MKWKKSVLFFLIICYIVLVPILPSSFNIKGIPANSNIILILILFFYSIRVLLYREYRDKFLQDFSSFIREYFGILLFAMILVMFLSIAVAFDKKIALKESLRFTSYIMLFFVIKYELEESKAIRKLLKIYMFMAAVVAGIAIIEYLIYFYKLRDTVDRYAGVYSTMDNPNMLGAFLMLALFPTVVLAIKEKGIGKKVIYAAASFMLCTAILFTYSRNALLGLFLGIILLSVLYSRKIIIYALGIGGISLLIPGVLNRITQITNMALNESRLKLWKTAFYMIKDHPIFGIGNGNFPYVYESYIKIHKELKHYYYVLPMHPHNLILDIQTELGIFGTIIFFLLLIVLASKFKQFREKVKDGYLNWFYSGFSISLCVFFFMNLLDSFFSAPKIEINLWILLAMHGAIIHSRKIH